MTLRILATTVALTATTLGTASAAPVQFSGNGQWYEMITNDSQTTFSGALAAATGQTWMAESGYLATVTSALEQAFLNTLNPSNITAWLGGADARNEADWRWVNGPESGLAFSYTNWAAGEPNNCCGGENGLLGWWSGDQWNDIYDGTGPYAYVVEYGSNPAAVPLPAALPLLGFGIGALGLAARRRKAT